MWKREKLSSAETKNVIVLIKIRAAFQKALLKHYKNRTESEGRYIEMIKVICH